MNCLSAFDLLNLAVQNTNDDPLLFSDAIGPFDPKRIRGGPAWAYSDYYSIVAKPSDPVANGPALAPTPATKLMRGPLRMPLLQDRFQLKFHREAEETPISALTVAAGGPKLNPSENGTCNPNDPARVFVLPNGLERPNWTIDRLNRVWAGWSLSNIMDRHVLDKTGITGLYTFNLVFVHDTNAPGNLPPEFPYRSCLRTFLPAQRLLRNSNRNRVDARADKGPRRYIVIDQLQRP